MAQFVFPEFNRDRVIGAINPDGDIDVHPLGMVPLVSPDARWWRYTCSESSASVALAVSEHLQLPNQILVAVSADLRRLWRVRNLFGDIRLSRLLDSRLIAAGGVPIDATSGD